MADKLNKENHETVPMSSAELEVLRVTLTEVMNTLQALKTRDPIYLGELQFDEKQRYAVQGKLMSARSIVYVAQAREKDL